MKIMFSIGAVTIILIIVSVLGARKFLLSKDGNIIS